VSCLGLTILSEDRVLIGVERSRSSRNAWRTLMSKTEAAATTVKRGEP
jgi:hypothetical protein